MVDIPYTIKPNQTKSSFLFLFVLLVLTKQYYDQNFLDLQIERLLINLNTSPAIDK